MAYRIANGNCRYRPPALLGFTLIELLVVMSIIALLLTLALPRYFNSVDRSRETVLRENLNVTRDAIDKFFADQGKYPDSLADLVSKGYLKKLPYDPETDSDATWVIVPPGDGEKGAVFDLHSAAPGKSMDGTAFADW